MKVQGKPLAIKKKGDGTVEATGDHEVADNEREAGNIADKTANLSLG